jgi:hypothetical protein
LKKLLMILALPLAALAREPTPPPGTTFVLPLQAPRPAAAPPLPVIRGQHFAYVLPPSWRVAEEGPYALLLVAPDSQAFTLMVGNAGMQPNYPLERFVREKLAVIHPQSLQIGPPRQVTAREGFRYALAFDIQYVSARGLPSRGAVECHVAPAYDTQLIVMTGAVATSAQWDRLAPWLPQVARQVAATDGGAFGQRGVMAQNIELSRSFGEAQRAYRESSARTWQQVTDQHDGTLDRENREVRENLGVGRQYANPYDGGRQVELPSTFQYYWTNREGAYVGTDDPSVNPNAGSTAEWRPMPRHGP